MSQTSSIRIATWFVMVAAALNALSWFVRSGGWGNLFGSQHDNPVGIGFPFLIWHNGYMQSGPDLSPVNFLVNVGLAILAGAFATWVIRKRNPSPRDLPHDEIEAEANATPLWQLSLGELMVGTAVLAIVFAASGRSSSLALGALKTIYIAGPVMFAWIAWMGRKLPVHWQPAVGLGPAIAMFVAAGWLDETIPTIRDFTRGLMGIFVCWIPQIVAFLLIDLIRRTWSAVGTRPATKPET